MTTPSNGALQLERGQGLALDRRQHVAGAHRVADRARTSRTMTGEARRDVRDAIGVRAHLAGQLDADVDVAGAGGRERDAEAPEVGHREARRRRCRVGERHAADPEGQKKGGEDALNVGTDHGFDSVASAGEPTRRSTSMRAWW